MQPLRPLLIPLGMCDHIYILKGPQGSGFLVEWPFSEWRQLV